MSHLPQRWLGIVLRILRGYYPDAEIAAWGPFVEGSPAGTDARLELVIIDPVEPDPDLLVEIRYDLERSDLPVSCDLRLFGELTIAEQKEVLDRGIRFGG